MKKKFAVKSVVCALLLCVTLGVSLVVHATWTQHVSPSVTFSTNIRSFTMQASIDCFGPGTEVTGTVSVRTTDGTQVPPGIMTGNIAMFNTFGDPRGITASYENTTSSIGFNLSTWFHPWSIPGTESFWALGSASARYETSFIRSATASVGTPSIRRNLVAELNMATFMHGLHNNEMVRVVGINNIAGLAFSSELRNATVGYINVYAGYCLTVVDQFPILPVTVTYIN